MGTRFLRVSVLCSSNFLVSGEAAATDCPVAPAAAACALRFVSTTWFVLSTGVSAVIAFASGIAGLFTTLCALFFLPMEGDFAFGMFGTPSYILNLGMD